MASPLQIVGAFSDKGVGGSGGCQAPWNRVRGPAGAMILSLRRIGWEVPHARCFRDDLGRSIDLLEYSPSDVGSMVHQGVQRWLWRLVALECGRPELSEGVALPPISSILRRPPKWATPRQLGSLCSTVEGGQWPQTRLFRAGLVLESRCPLCHGASGTGAQTFRVRCNVASTEAACKRGNATRYWARFGDTSAFHLLASSASTLVGPCAPTTSAPAGVALGVGASPFPWANLRRRLRQSW